jgi:hypothetical protein
MRITVSFLDQADQRITNAAVRTHNKYSQYFLSYLFFGTFLIKVNAVLNYQTAADFLPIKRQQHQQPVSGAWLPGGTLAGAPRHLCPAWHDAVNAEYAISAIVNHEG